MGIGWTKLATAAEVELPERAGAGPRTLSHTHTHTHTHTCLLLANHNWCRSLLWFVLVYQSDTNNVFAGVKIFGRIEFCLGRLIVHLRTKWLRKIPIYFIFVTVSVATSENSAEKFKNYECDWFFPDHKYDEHCVRCPPIALPRDIPYTSS